MFSYELATIRKGRARSATLLTFITRMGKQLPCYRSLSPLDMQQDRGYKGNNTDDNELCPLLSSCEVTGPDSLGS